MFSHSSKQQIGTRKDKTDIQKSKCYTSKVKKVDDSKEPECNSADNKKLNMRNALSSSKMPVRLGSKTVVPSKSNFKRTVDEKSKKNKVIGCSNSDESCLPKGDKTNTKLDGKQVGTIKKSSLVPSSTTRKISHSLSREASNSDAAKGKTQKTKLTYASKKLLPNKSILKGLSNSDWKLNKPSQTEGSGNSKIPNLYPLSKMKRVTFKNLSVSDLSKNSGNIEFRTNSKTFPEINSSSSVNAHKRTAFKNENNLKKKEMVKCAEHHMENEDICTDKRNEELLMNLLLSKEDCSQNTLLYRAVTLVNKDTDIKISNGKDRTMLMKTPVENNSLVSHIDEIILDSENTSSCQVVEYKKISKVLENIPSCQIIDNKSNFQSSVENRPSCLVAENNSNSNFPENVQSTDIKFLDVAESVPNYNYTKNIDDCENSGNASRSEIAQSVPDIQLAQKASGAKNGEDKVVPDEPEKKNNETCESDANYIQNEESAMRTLEVGRSCISENIPSERGNHEENSSNISVTSTSSTSSDAKLLARKQLIEKSVNEKIRMLTDKYLKEINERKSKLPCIYKVNKLEKLRVHEEILPGNFPESPFNDENREKVHIGTDNDKCLSSSEKSKKDCHKRHIQSVDEQNTFQTRDAGISEYREQDIKETPKTSKIPRILKSPKTVPCLQSPLKNERFSKRTEESMSKFYQNVESHQRFKDSNKTNDNVPLEKDCTLHKDLAIAKNTFHSKIPIKSVHDTGSKSPTLEKSNDCGDGVDIKKQWEDTKSALLKEMEDKGWVKRNKNVQVVEKENKEINSDEYYSGNETDKLIIDSSSPNTKLHRLRNVFKNVPTQHVWGIWHLVLALFLVMILLFIVFIM